MIKKPTPVYISEPTGISFEIGRNNLFTIFASNGKKEFVFQGSTRQTIKKVAKALLEIADYDLVAPCGKINCNGEHNEY